VSIDYYMASPVPDIDICYSSFQGGNVHEVPVIRIYGSTPAGQKTCLHVHRALPYLYVSCSDLCLQPDQEADVCANIIPFAVEKALKLKGKAGSKRQHVHSCNLVRGKKFYGYHSSEELFAKIYLYYPQDVNRTANLLLEGAIFDKIIQPHESHIPFLLQFLVDYNLYGMGHLHVSKLKFRNPVPDVLNNREHTNHIHFQIQVVIQVQVHQSGYLPQFPMVGFGRVVVNFILPLQQYLVINLLNVKVLVNLREMLLLMVSR
jgi:DNA polymerase zeta